MNGCQRRRIPDSDTFKAHGYNESAIQHVSDTDLSAIPQGYDLSSVDALYGGSFKVNNEGGYVARCTTEYDRSGQHHSVTSDNFDTGQTLTVSIPAGTINIRFKCEAATGLAWEPWKTIFDKTYLSPVQQTFTLKGTTLSPSFSVSDSV